MSSATRLQGMRPRLAFGRLAADIYQSMLAVDAAIDRANMDARLLELVRIRSSQLNGCAFCIDMHTKDARANGETEQRIYALSAWRDAPFFSERERAALALTEAATRLSDDGVSDLVYEGAAKQFTSTELAALLGAISMINAWNRIAIATHMVAGRYQPRDGRSMAQNGAEHG